MPGVDVLGLFLRLPVTNPKTHTYTCLVGAWRWDCFCLTSSRTSLVEKALAAGIANFAESIQTENASDVQPLLEERVRGWAGYYGTRTRGITFLRRIIAGQSLD